MVSQISQKPEIHAATSDTCEIDAMDHTDIQRIGATTITTEKAHIQFTQKLTAHQLELKSVGNFTQLIQSLPMVFNLQSGNSVGKPMVQGFVGLRVPIFKNGIRLEGQSWGLDHAPEIDANAVQQIRLLSGVDALLLTSEGFGNPIWVNSIQNFNHPLHYWDGKFSVGYQSNGHGLMASGQLQGHNTFIAARSRVSGNYRTPQFWVYNTGLQEHSLQIQHKCLVKKPKVEQIWGVEAYYFEAGIMLESHIGSIADLQNAIHRDSPTYPSVFKYTVNKPKQVSNQNQVFLRRSISKESARWGFIQWVHQYSIQSNLRQEFDPHKNPKITFPQLSLLQITAKATHQFHSNKNINAHLINEAQMQDYGGFYYVPSYQLWHSGMAIAKTYNKKRGALLVGIRGDIHLRQITHIYSIASNHQQHIYLAPSGSVSWISKKNSDYRWAGSDFAPKVEEIKERDGHYEIHYNHVWRMPAVNELYARGVHHGTASYEEGNANLKPEWAEKFEFQWFGKLLILTSVHSKNNLNISQIHPITLQFSANTFGLYSPNLIHLFPQAQPVITVRGAFPSYRYAQIASAYAGIQPNLNIKFKNWIWQHQFQLTYAQLLHRPGDTSAGNAAILSAKYPPFIPPINYASSLQFTHKNWFFQGEIKYVAYQHWYNANLDLLTPPKSYLILNFMVNFKPRKHSAHSFSGYIQNATNQQYRDYLDRFRYFMDQPGINVGIKYHYHFHQHHSNH